MDIQSFADRAADLIGQLVDAQVSVPEDSTVLSYDHPTVIDAIRLVGETVGFLGEIEEESQGDERFTDLAYLARMELGVAREDLRDVAGRKKTWQALGQAASAMSRSESALVALERELHAALGKPPPKRPGVLAESLEIRSHYARFRDWVARHQPGTVEVLSRLGEAAEKLRRLQQIDVYPLMRIQDRREVRSLLDRIAAARKREPDQEAISLWKDLQAAGQLLLQINHRQELVEHDLEHLGTEVPTSETVRALSGGSCAKFAIHHRRLLGRDRALDEVLLHPGRFDVEEAEKRLRVVRKRLLGGIG